MASPYEKMWSEENMSCSDAWHSLKNYGPLTEARYGCGIKNGLVFIKDFHGAFYLTKEEDTECANSGHAFFSSAENVKAFSRDVEEAKKSTQKEIEQLISSPLKNEPTQIIAERFDAFGYALGQLFVCYSMTQPQRMTRLEEAAKVALRRHKSPYELPEIIASEESIHLTPLGKEFFSQSFHDLVKGEDTAISMRFAKNPLFEETVKKDLLPEQKLETLGLSDQELHILKTLRQLTTIRLKLRYAWMLATYYAESFLAELSQRLSTSKENLRLYEPKELEALLQNAVHVPETVLAERRQGYVAELQDGSIKSLQGKQALEYLQSHTRAMDESRTSLKGMVTCKGHHIGRAVILSYRHPEEHPEKILRMSPGDIIVSEMTRPNIMSAVQKAGAIVTDEGGITCHAAIVSREFNLPCIVGTKHATSIFHDGDILEVDAHRGIVTLLKNTPK